MTFGPADQCLGHLDTLSLTARKLMGVSLFESLKPHLGEPRGRSFTTFRRTYAPKQQAEFDILDGRFPRQQRILLE